MKIKTAFTLFPLLLLASAALAEPPREPASAVTPLAVPGTPSPLFALRVNGVTVPVLAFKDIHYAHFTMTDAAQVDVLVQTGTVTRARVQPTPFGIVASVNTDRTCFTLPRPMHIVVQIDYLEKLFIFAESPAEDTPAHAINAVTAGAVGDGVTDSTLALQSAILALPRNGTLLIPPGHFRSGSLLLHSDMTLHLAPGALLQAVDDHTRIKPIPSAPSMIAFLAAENVTNLSVTGYGTLDANGFKIRRAYEKAENIKKKPGRALFVRNGQNITLRGITVRDSYSWNVDAQFVDNLTISDVKILSDVRLSNHDGIDLESCKDVTVSDCFIFSEDDGLTPKARAGRDIVENHTFRNCVIWAHKANGIRVGSESACVAMRNFLFENIYILNGADGIRLDTTEGAIYENMIFRNVWMEDFLQHYDNRYERNRERQAIHPSRSIVLYVNHSDIRGKRTPLGRIRNITFENVHWRDDRVSATLMLPKAIKQFAAETQQTPLIEAIRFSGCTRAGKPIKVPADAGFLPNEAAPTSSFTFE
jgi:polygalacturonase